MHDTSGRLDQLSARPRAVKKSDVGQSANKLSSEEWLHRQGLASCSGDIQQFPNDVRLKF